MTQDYVYQPLPPVTHVGIFSRLIRLFAGEANTQLRCSIVMVNVEQCVRYEALSYAWGSEPPQSSILIDGCLLAIKPNLSNALQHLRLPQLDRYLWVDAMCIDQSNDLEKTRQVGYMKRIYQNAARAIVWLGLKTPGIEVAFQVASRLMELESMMLSDTSAAQGWDLDVRAQLVADTINDCPDGSLQYLSELFDRDYFSRVWCIQEVVVSSWATAKCGELEIPFMDIISVADLTVRLGILSCSETNVAFWDKIYRAYRAKDAARNSGDLVQEQEPSMGTLLTNLHGTRHFKATDPRDKLFALLGISKEDLDPMNHFLPSTSGMRGGKENKVGGHIYAPPIEADSFCPEALKPNYSKSCLEVYRDFVRHQVTKGPRGLHILHYVHHTNPLGGSDFPSWVPKFFEPIPDFIVPAQMYLAGLCNGQFDLAARASSGQLRYFANVHDEPLHGVPLRPNILSIEGYLIDEIVTTSDPLTADDKLTDQVECMWQAVFGFDLFPPRQQTYRNGQPLDFAFHLSLGMGLLGTMNVMSLEIQRSHRSLQWTTGPKAMETLTNIRDGDVLQFMKDHYTSQGFGHQCPQLRVGTPSAELGIAISANRYAQVIRRLATNRRVFLTRNGYLGLGPPLTQPGDQICVLYGGRLPFVIRPTGNRSHHFLIGACYLHDDDILMGITCQAVRSKDSTCPFVDQTFHII